ncbi:glycosyltransferase family 2 protein [Luteipulveratus halotolerans]|uniref:Glycosyltransferase 2-like domain-containing protein n=1 Tax=Luteipulveratus halotolerans TaxID=1631356 RepID=A0A0L6CJG9_9MICO|nr:glycosyltransferase family 2 protein [Luteipulveratus halotolerans]KNX37760.1 hypothetical protein VV01_12345 [Luteipulveratus halotolerans]
MSPRLSVVVPFYGVEHYIGDCLESIQVQELEDIEVVMVDDGSPDGSRAVAQTFVDADPRFRIVTQENAGLGPARNTGTAHSTGDYITFIDSDDLVTRHGFRRMVNSLEESGSSFVGGNARRFNNSSGVKPSWAHLHAFARSMRATHVFENPVLARDRMVWNKVYRRSFWDEFGYEFPPIRYEDYPVTLKAHMEAVTVDIISDPVYYWRERESGDSITQQVYRYDNLLDRVTSASMVIDLVADAPAAVRQRTHIMLAESDYIAIVQAFAEVPDDQVDQILELGHNLVGRMGVEAINKRTRYDQLQYHALMARDVELLRELAVFRRDGGLRGGARAVPTPRTLGRYEYRYPGHGRSYLPRDLFLAPAKEMSLRTAVSDVRWDHDDLLVRGVAEIRHIPTTEQSTLKVWAVTKTRRHLLSTRRFDDVDSHGDLRPVGFEVRLDADLLAKLAADDQTVSLDVQLGNHKKNRRGLLRGMRPGSATWPQGGWVEDQVWLQPGPSRGGELKLRWVREPWQIVDASVEGTQMRLVCDIPRPLQIAQLVIDGNAYSPELHYPTTCTIADGRTRVEALIPLDEVLDNTESDDPYLATTTRAVRLRAAGKREMLLWTGPTRSVGAAVGEHQFRLTRSPAGLLNLRETAVRMTADSVDLIGEGADQRLVVRGRNWSDSSDWTLDWRRFIPGSDDAVRVACEQDVGSSWSATVRAADLLGDVGDRSPTDSLASLADWTLFVTSGDGSLETAVITEPFLNATLPLDVCLDGLRGRLRPRADTLHLDVRHDRRSEV